MHLVSRRLTCIKRADLRCFSSYSSHPVKNIQQVCKERGFLFPSSEVYGGMSGSFDYGPRGVQLKKNISNRWWHDFIERRKNCVGIDSSIVLHPKVWQNTGHVDLFTDALVECKVCQVRQRADHIIEDLQLDNLELPPSNTQEWLQAMTDLLKEHKVKCKSCGSKDSFTDTKLFNLLFETKYGGHDTYLRPETAQGIFLNFANVIKTNPQPLPMGIGQIGKSFRNEISPANFIFRTREFEQMELEYFCHPEESKKYYQYWIEEVNKWLVDLGILPQNMRLAVHGPGGLAHYSSMATDVEFKYPHGWGELWGIAHRGSYDLDVHEKGVQSKTDRIRFQYHDVITNKKYTPHVIEPSVGLDRLIYAVLVNGYEEEVLADGSARRVLKLQEDIAPVKFAVCPMRTSADLTAMADKVFDLLTPYAVTEYNRTGSIGKRYFRNDEIGTPYCVTIDLDSLQDQTVTVRERDSRKQIRMHIDELVDAAAKKKSLLSLFDISNEE